MKLGNSFLVVVPRLVIAVFERFRKTASIDSAGELVEMNYAAAVTTIVGVVAGFELVSRVTGIVVTLLPTGMKSVKEGSAA